MLEKSENDMIEISVSDTGIGICQQDQKKLFKLFGFLDKTQKLNPRGIGLGLFISKQITQAYGGDIHIESKKDVGSKFTFVIQLDKQDTQGSQIMRCLNPYQKTYPQMSIDIMKFKSVENLS